MPLLDDLMAFAAEHRLCERLDGGVEGAWVRMRCDCGAEILRPVDGEDGRER